MPPDQPARPKLVDSALTALHQGLNPLDAALFALNHHFGLALKGTDAKSPPVPPPPHDQPGPGAGGPPRGKPKPPPQPKPPPKPCKAPPPGVSCPRNWYWDTHLCRCEPLPNPGAQ